MCGTLGVVAFSRKIAAQSVRRSHHKGRAARGIRKMFACIFAQKLVFTRTRARSGENNFYANDPWIRTVCALPYFTAELVQAVSTMKDLALTTDSPLVAGVRCARSQCRCRVQTPIAATGGSFKYKNI